MSSSTTIRTRWISATLSIPSFCRNTLFICSLSYSCSLAARCQALPLIFLWLLTTSGDTANAQEEWPRRGFTIQRQSWIATHSTLQCTKDGPRWPFTSCRFSTTCTQWSTSWSLTNSANCEHHYCHVQTDKPTTFLGYSLLYRPVASIDFNKNSCFLPLFVFVHIFSKFFLFSFKGKPAQLSSKIPQFHVIYILNNIIVLLKLVNLHVENCAFYHLKFWNLFRF